MKQLIILLLLSYCFCPTENIKHFKKYQSIQFHSEIGIVYLDVGEFELGDTIHILLKAVNGPVNNILFYEFNDEEPTNINKNFAHSTIQSSTSSSSYYTPSESKRTLSYYYEIEKEKNTKYLVMKYTDFSGQYLEIENNKANWAFIIIICIIFGLIAIAIAGFLFYRYMQKRGIRRNFVDYNQDQDQEKIQTTVTRYQQNTYTNTKSNPIFKSPFSIIIS